MKYAPFAAHGKNHQDHLDYLKKNNLRALLDKDIHFLHMSENSESVQSGDCVML